MESSGLGRTIQRKHGRCIARCRSTSCSARRFALLGTRSRLSSFAAAGRCDRWGRCAAAARRIRQLLHLFEPHDVLIRNLPPKILFLAALDRVLLKEDRSARVGNERARSRQENITGAVVYLDPAPQKGGIAGHTGLSLGFAIWRVNGTEVLSKRTAKPQNINVLAVLCKFGRCQSNAASAR